MSALREAAQQALEALDAGVSVSPKSVLHDRLRAALAQQEKEQEPVAWMLEDADKGHFIFRAVKPFVREWETLTPLYTHPRRREWRNLTMQEINALPEVGGRMWNMGSAVSVLRAIRAIEQALKERNT